MDKDKPMDTDNLSLERIKGIIHTQNGTDSQMEQNGNSVLDDNYSKEIYKYTDRGPYFLIAEKSDIDHIDLGLSLKRLPNTNLINIVKISHNKVRIQAKNYHAANQLIAHKSLYNLNEYKIYLPKQYVVTEGLIRNIPVKYSLKEIRDNITTNYDIEEIERLNTWDFKEQKKKPTENIKISFRANNIPEQIHIAYCPVKVLIYVQRPLFCRTCLSYEHTAKHCKTKTPLCNNCSEIQHDKNILCETKCKFCTRTAQPDTYHRSSSLKCPAYQIQFEIRKIMATKKVCFWEAKQELLQQNPQLATKKPPPQTLLFSQLFNKGPNEAIANDIQSKRSQTIDNTPTCPPNSRDPNSQSEYNQHTKFILTLLSMIQASINNGTDGEHILQQVNKSLYRYSEKNSLLDNQQQTTCKTPLNNTFHFNNGPSTSKPGTCQ